MTPHLTLYVELALSVLLAATLAYCVVLERRLNAVRSPLKRRKKTLPQRSKLPTRALCKQSADKVIMSNALRQ